MSERISSKIVRTVEQTTQEVLISKNATVAEKELLFNHLLKFCVAITGADEFEIAAAIKEKNNRFVFEESITTMWNNLNPLVFDNIREID